MVAMGRDAGVCRRRRRRGGPPRRQVSAVAAVAAAMTAMVAAAAVLTLTGAALWTPSTAAKVAAAATDAGRGGRRPEVATATGVGGGSRGGGAWGIEARRGNSPSPSGRVAVEPRPPPAPLSRAALALERNTSGGFPPTASRVIGGAPMTWSQPSSFQAKLFVGDKFACSGTLITRRHILTAAHCPSVVGSVVLLGGLGRRVGLPLLASSMTLHPQYNSSTSASDVAVVQLERDVRDSEFVDHQLSLARLNRWPWTPAAGAPAMLTGWGFTSEFPGGTPTESLHIAHVNVLTTDECNKIHQSAPGGFSIDWQQDLCAWAYQRRSCWGVRFTTEGAGAGSGACGGKTCWSLVDPTRASWWGVCGQLLLRKLTTESAWLVISVAMHPIR